MNEQTKITRQNIEELLISLGYKVFGYEKFIRLDKDLGKINPNASVEINYGVGLDWICGYICIDGFSEYLKPFLQLRSLLDRNQVPYTEVPSRKDFVEALRTQAKKFDGLADVVEDCREEGKDD